MIKTYGENLVRQAESIIDEQVARGVILEAGSVVENTDIGSEEDGISSLTLNISDDCQLNCRYCFADGGSYGVCSESPMMSSEVMRAAVDLLRQVGNRNKISIVFFGGEPLLNWPLMKECVEYSRSVLSDHVSKLYYSVTTNAIGLDDEKVAYMRENMIVPLVSIDGTGEVHNSLRPMKNSTLDSLEHTLAGLRKLVNAGFDYIRIRATETAYSEPLQEYIDYYSSSENISRFNFQPIVCSRESDMYLDSISLNRFEAEAVDLVLRGGLDIDPLGTYIDRIRRKHRRTHFCAMGSRTAVVTVNGDVYPCHRIAGVDEFRFGNVLSPSHIDFASMKSIVENLGVDNLRECNSCWMRYICGGTCYGENYSENGDLSRVFSVRCHMIKKIIYASIEKVLMELHPRDEAVTSK